MGTRLYRSRDDRILAGVAGGVADYFDLDPSLVRIGWALLVFAGGFGLLLYIVMAIVVPEEPWAGEQSSAASPEAPGGAAGIAASGAGAVPGTSPAAPDWRAQRAAERATRRAARRADRDGGGRTAGLVIGGLFVLFGIALLAQELFPAITFDYFWPLVLVAIGVVVLAAALRGDSRGAPPPPPPPPSAGEGGASVGGPGTSS